MSDPLEELFGPGSDPVVPATEPVPEGAIPDEL